MGTGSGNVGDQCNRKRNGDPAGNRTQNTRLKRPVLCQLSYRVEDRILAHLRDGGQAEKWHQFRLDGCALNMQGVMLSGKRNRRSPALPNSRTRNTGIGTRAFARQRRHGVVLSAGPFDRT